MTSIAELVVGGLPEQWESFGFAKLSSEGARTLFSLGDMALVVDSSHEPGMVSWTLVGSPAQPALIDGVATSYAANTAPTSSTARTGAPAGRVGCLGVDHVVIRTNDLERTCAAIADATGAEVRRVRDAGGGVTQAFHKLADVVVEVVAGGEHVEATHLWGFVVNVADLDALAQWAGPDVVGVPKPATQPGRRIATARSGAGLGVPFALMDVAN
jgi:hypothetical protein